MPAKRRSKGGDGAAAKVAKVTKVDADTNPHVVKLTDWFFGLHVRYCLFSAVFVGFCKRMANGEERNQNLNPKAYQQGLCCWRA